MSTETTCDHACNPEAPGSLRPSSRHFLDCPVWSHIGVVPPELTHITTDAEGAEG